MNYYELKRLKTNIDAQKLRVAAARAQAVSLSASIDGTPPPDGGTVYDRVGMSVGHIIIEEEKLNALYERFTKSIKAIPDEYIKTLIHCKLVKRWSWTRIAAELGGGNTGDGVRKAVVRYSW